jgi:hypothetical protein
MSANTTIIGSKKPGQLYKDGEEMGQAPGEVQIDTPTQQVFTSRKKDMISSDNLRTGGALMETTPAKPKTKTQPKPKPTKPRKTVVKAKTRSAAKAKGKGKKVIRR